jgi:uncharacterized membrane protein
LEKVATFALNVAGVWAFFSMIAFAFEFADRDYDMNNPRGSFRMTSAHWLFLGGVMVFTILFIIFCAVTTLPHSPVN